MTPADLFPRISSLLEQAGIPYMLTGSFACSVYGMHRGSPDIDFIITADQKGIWRLIDLLPEYDFRSDLEEALESLRAASAFYLIENKTGMRIDLMFQKDRVFSQEEFRRRRSALVAGMDFYIASPEDVVLATMESAKLGSLHRQIEDIAGILKVQNDELDLPYIEKWVTELGLTSEWDSARQLAGLE